MTQDDRLTGDQNQEPEWRWRTTAWNCPCPLPLLPANTFIIITIIRWTEWCLQCDPDHYSSVLQNENVFTNVCVYLLYRIRNIYLQETKITKAAVHYLTLLIFRRVRDGGWLGPAERGRGPALHPPACEQNLLNCQSAFIFITVNLVRRHLTLYLSPGQRAHRLQREV